MKLLSQSLQSGYSNPEYTKDQLHLLESRLDTFNELLVSSAYLRSTGTKLLSDKLNLDKFSKLTAIIGANNQSTSAQGVKHLLDLNFNTYLVNTNRRDCIFHLKTMLSIGDKKAILLTGSPNLTGQGMAKNFEHQVAIEFDLESEEDLKEVCKIKDYLKELPTSYPENVIIANQPLIDDMLVSGQLENEEVHRTSNSETRGLDSINDKKGPAIKIPRPPKEKPKEAEADASTLTSTLGSGVLVWKKNKLSKSDAQISGTDNTNVKGYMTMGNKSYRKDRHGNPVDNKTYMKEDVFGDLDWVLNNEIERDEAFANFEFWLDGKFISVCRLLITDKPSREPAEHGLADQKQPTTALHVCGFGKEFTNVLGKNLQLYKLDTNNYRIEVS
ncbi:TPA: phospholipase D family protein [Vibrio parahaemolyticus]|nr:phospholipase D family protein [Vibrio parahaemolyticus]